MKKLPILLLLIGTTPIIAGIYGILHDQLTYTISPEYYTKFKFYQFGLMDMGNEAIFPNPRVEVAIVGFLATWWVGLPIGIILGLVGLIHKTRKQMKLVTFKAILFAILVTFICGLVGLFYGKFYLSNENLDWWFPENLIDRKNFIAVGSMHNFGYLGGLIGLIVGIVYSLDSRFKLETSRLSSTK